MIQLLKEEAKNKNKNGMISKICKRCSILMCCNTRNFSYTDLTLATRNQVFQAWNREWITRGKLFWHVSNNAVGSSEHDPAISGCNVENRRYNNVNNR